MQRWVERPEARWALWSGITGALTMFVSAVLTGGVGPWLPFQMLSAAWIGYFAGCLPRASGRKEVWMLAAYGAVAGLAYGLVMDMWFWPFATSSNSELHFVAGAPVVENLRRFWAFHLTSALGFDIPRAVSNALLVLIAGAPVLAALRRAARRAAFDSEPVFVQEPESVRSQPVARQPVPSPPSRPSA